MEPPKTVSLGPWRGMSNTYDETSPRYATTEQSLGFLRDALNVDIDRDGFVRRRDGYTRLAAMKDAHSLAAVGPYMLVIDDGTLWSILLNYERPKKAALVSGLAPDPMRWAFAGMEAYGCNGTDTVRVTSAMTASPWALPNPGTPTLSYAPVGELPPGKYLVATTHVSSDGRESGAALSAPIMLNQQGGIHVTPQRIDPSASWTNIYVTEPNGTVLYYTSTSAENTLVTQTPMTHDPLQTMNLTGPPEGAYMVQAYRGRLLVCAGSALYWSQPLTYHLFNLAVDVQMFASPPVMIAPLNTGFYIATEDTVYWVAGDDPSEWTLTQVDTPRVTTTEPLIIQGAKIPALESEDLVALWVTSDGLVAGREGGRTVLLTREMLAIDPHEGGSLVHREHKGISHILTNLRKRTQQNAFQATDRAECVVTRSNRTTSETIYDPF